MDARSSHRRAACALSRWPSTSRTTSCSRPASRCTPSTAASSPGRIGVRRAQPGEKLTTLDGTVRGLDPDDLVVTDDTGPIALAGVMGGASTEIDAGTTDIVLEAAHWEPTSIARAVRRHKLPSEAAKRFERGVDPEIAAVALQRCVDLLVRHGGAVAAPGFTVVGSGPAPVEIQLRVESPGQVAGLPIDAPTVLRRLIQVGCTVRGADVLTVTPPSWRPDLTDPADLVEEVVRLVGYDRVPSALPTPPPGRGLAADATATSHLRAGARRRRLHRGAELSVRLAVGARPVRLGRRRPAPARDRRRQSAVRRRTRAADVAAARAAGDAHSKSRPRSS